MQFCLIGGAENEVVALSREWLGLCKLTTSPEDRDKIEKQFDTLFPILHLRQLLNVDPILVDTLMLEGLFSVERRKYDKSKTASRFDDMIYWDRAVIKNLRDVGRAAGEAERALSRTRRESRQFGPVKQAVEQSASDWCSTYGQVHAVMVQVRDHFLPMFSEEAMSAAPRVRSFKTDDSYSSRDLKLAESWATKLQADASEGAYRRDISCDELAARGREVRVRVQLPPASKEDIPMRPRALNRYGQASAAAVENELKCHLPLSRIAMRAACNGQWPHSISLKLLLATLLPPNISGKKMLPCYRTGGGILKGNTLVAVAVFSKNALAFLEYLGDHGSDVYDIEQAEPRVGMRGAGSAAAFFVLGPFGVATPDRIRHGHMGFSSIFTAEEDTAADRALAL